MKESPQISIITVIFNAEKTIVATISSIASQTYKDIEFIIVDGGSTDGTLEIINSHQEKINAFVSEPDQGVYDAMNKGIKIASGKWILFLGADDLLYDEHTVMNVVQRLQEDYHLIYGDVIKTPQNVVYDGPFNLYKLIYKNICHQAIFFNRKVFELKGDYDINYKVNADWEFNLKCFQDPNIKTKYIPEIISYFNAEGLSSSAHDEAFEQRKKHLIKLMPVWVKACYKYRRSITVKRISKLFLNFDYA